MHSERSLPMLWCWRKNISLTGKQCCVCELWSLCKWIGLINGGNSCNLVLKCSTGCPTCKSETRLPCVLMYYQWSDTQMTAPFQSYSLYAPSRIFLGPNPSTEIFSSYAAWRFVSFCILGWNKKLKTQCRSDRVHKHYLENCTPWNNDTTFHWQHLHVQHMSQRSE